MNLAVWQLVHVWVPLPLGLLLQLTIGRPGTEGDYACAELLALLDKSMWPPSGRGLPVWRGGLTERRSPCVRALYFPLLRTMLKLLFIANARLRGGLGVVCVALA